MTAHPQVRRVHRRRVRLSFPLAVWAGLLAAATILPLRSEEPPVTAPAHEASAPAARAAIPPAQSMAAALKRDAVAQAQRLVEAYPGDALTYALLGAAYFNTGRSEEAEKELKKCLELNPNQVDADQVLARIAYEKGDLDDSIRLCREALKRGPVNPEILNQLGRALMDLAKTDEAVQALQQAVQVPNPLAQSYYLLGQALLQSNNFADAKKDFLRAIALLPDHTQAYFGLSRACLGLNQTDEAQRSREQFVKLEAIDRRSLKDRSAQEDTLTGLPMVRETVARTFFGAGQVYQVHQQPAKAAELYLKAVRLDAQNPVYRAALEAFYVNAKDLTNGIAIFEQLSKEEPENHLNYLFLGRMRARIGQGADAVAAFRKVVQLAPQSPEGYRNLAELELRANRNLDEARTAARRLVELAPSGPAYYLLSVACFRNGDHAGAVDALQQAVALAPGEKRYRAMLEQLERAPK